MSDLTVSGFFMALFAGICAGGAATPIKWMTHLVLSELVRGTVG